MNKQAYYIYKQAATFSSAINYQPYVPYDPKTKTYNPGALHGSFETNRGLVEKEREEINRQYDALVDSTEDADTQGMWNEQRDARLQALNSAWNPINQKHVEEEWANRPQGVLSEMYNNYGISGAFQGYGNQVVRDAKAVGNGIADAGRAVGRGIVGAGKWVGNTASDAYWGLGRGIYNAGTGIGNFFNNTGKFFRNLWGGAKNYQN